MRSLSFVLLAAFVAGSVQAGESLYGIELGRALSDQLPQCADRIGPLTPTTCWSRSTLPSHEGERRYDLFFAEPESPPGMRTPSIIEVNGLVAAVIVSTLGEYFQVQLLANLTKKFGKPMWVRRTPMQNSFGVRHVAIDALWKGSGYVAELHGFESDVDYGRIVLMTGAQTEVETQRDRERARNRRPL